MPAITWPSAVIAALLSIDCNTARYERWLAAVSLRTSWELLVRRSARQHQLLQRRFYNTRRLTAGSTHPRYTSRRNSGGEPAQTAPSSIPKSEQHMGQQITVYYTGLFKMNVGVLTTCHIQYTRDRIICIFVFNRPTLHVFVTYLTGALYVHPLWFYKHQHDNR